MNAAMIRVLASRPDVVVASVVLGGATGWAFPGLAHELGLVSDVLIALMKVMALPLMMSAVIFGLNRLFRQGEAASLASRMLRMFVLVMAATALVSLAVNLLIPAGKDLPLETQATLGRVVGSMRQGGVDDEMTLYAVPQETLSARALVRGVIDQVIPDNIFRALSQGENIKAFVVALLIGCALARVPAAIAESFSQSVESVFKIGLILIGWFNYCLPIMLFCIVASQVGQTGLEPVQLMARFTAALVLASSVFILGSFWVLARVSGLPWRQVLFSQREPLTVALATQNLGAAIPAMYESLAIRMGFSTYRVELLIPLGLTLMRVGPVFFYMLATFFVAHLYGRVLGPQEILILVFGSVLAGFTSIGMTGLLALSQLGVVCGLLGLPFEAALPLFLVLEPVSNVLRAVVQVAVTNAWVAAVCGQPEGASVPVSA